jgi:hypothetical protein
VLLTGDVETTRHQHTDDHQAQHGGWQREASIGFRLHGYFHS